MSQQYFDQLLKKYLSGECTKEEEAIVNEWSQQMLEESQLDISPEEKEQIRKRLWVALNVDGSTTEISRIISIKRAKTRYILYSAAAAACVILAFAGWYLYYQPTSHNSNLTQTTEIPASQVSVTNNTGAEKEIKLNDGSIVRLQPKATIYYPRAFASDSREVYLTGDAFFKVSHDSLKRFRVNTFGLVTEVLGTSFYIHQEQSANKLQVEVLTGKVSVYQQGKRKKNAQRDAQAHSVILTPNQKVTYNASNSQFITSLVDEPKPIEQKRTLDTRNFIYDDVPITTVLEELEVAYGIEISTENTAIQNCRFTGDITKQDLYKKLEVICQSLPFSSYEVRGVNIIVKGKGCD